MKKLFVVGEFAERTWTKMLLDTVVHNVQCVCHTVGIVDKDSCSSQS